MKTLGKLKLNQLNQDELTEREMEYLRGGGTTPGNCVCKCDGNPDNTASQMTSSSKAGDVDDEGNACTCIANTDSAASYQVPTGTDVSSCTCAISLMAGIYENSPTK